MTPEIPTWSEIAKAGDAFDLEPFKAMAEEAGQNPVDAEQAKTGSKVRVHEGFHSGANGTFDPDKFVPVKNGEDGKLAPGTGFYFTNLGADGLSDYYHDHSKLYTNSDGSELDRSGVAFTLDPKTHVTIKDSKDYGDFLRKYHRFFDYNKGKGNPIWGVLPDWEAAARDGIGSVQFPYESLNNTEGRSLYSEYWTGPNGERGQPQYIYPHPNEGFILRPEAVVTQRPYDYFKEKVPNAKDPSTEDRHLAGLTPEGKAFMEDVYKKMYFSPSELKYWHAFARKHPEMTREQLRREYGGLWKSVKSVKSGLSTMAEYPEIPTWDQITKMYNKDPTAFQKGLNSNIVRPSDPVWSNDLAQNLNYARTYAPDKLWNAYVNQGVVDANGTWTARHAPNDDVWNYMMQSVSPEQRGDKLKYRGTQPIPGYMPGASDPEDEDSEEGSAPTGSKPLPPMTLPSTGSKPGMTITTGPSGSKGRENIPLEYPPAKKED